MNARALWGQLFLLALLLLVAGQLLYVHLDTTACCLATPSPTRLWGASSALLAYGLGCVVLWKQHRPAPKHKHRDSSDSEKDKTAILLVWASQGGFAEHIAQRSAQSLHQGGVCTHLLPLDHVTAKQLQLSQQAVFVVSTTGEGDAPDHAIAFLRQVMAQSLSLSHLQYAIVALGDRNYAQFCAFGHQLNHWLRHCGARALFDLVEVDRADPAALRHWQQLLGQLSVQPNEQPDWSQPQYRLWRLHAREHLNPGSAGAPVFHLKLQPKDGPMPHWRAGDIAEVGPKHATQSVCQWMQQHGFAENTLLPDGRLLTEVLARSHWPDQPSNDLDLLVQSLTPLPHREYSIASLPNEGALHLLVRRHRHSNGQLGLGSGWLCEHAAIGESISLRLRSNRNFHPPSTTAPLILIGNGTGMAGLRAHLRARIDSNAPSARRNWLLFGERKQNCDFYFHQELQQWQRAGWIERLDTVFSREGQSQRYVQDSLAAQSELLGRWVAEGAVILVCGSLHMALAIDTVLSQTLGNDYKEHLVIEQRYRRDVY